MAGACKAAKAVITVDAGPLHVAAAVGTPVMGIFGNDEKGVGASPIRLWLPPTDNVCRTISTIIAQNVLKIVSKIMIASWIIIIAWKE